MATKNVLISHYGFEQDQLDHKIQDRRFIARFGHEVEVLAEKWIQSQRAGKLDSKLDRELRNKIWRPSVALASYPELQFNTYYLLYNKAKNQRKEQIEKLEHEIDIIVEDIKMVCQGITVIKKPLLFENISNPWEINEVFPKLNELFKEKPFHENDTNYYVFCNNGTLQTRISLFLLTHQQQINAKRINAMAWKNRKQRDLATAQGEASCSARGTYEIEDPREVSRAMYDKLAQGEVNAKGDKKKDEIQTGIRTLNKPYKSKLELISKVAENTRDPILLTGPTGSGKTQIATNIASMRQNRAKQEIPFKKANCASFSGDPALARSQLFGHSAYAYSGAGDTDQDGLLKQADGGILFLDEIGELPKEVQAMLLTAIESDESGKKRFLRLGDGKEIASDFMLICGTNHDLWEDVAKGTFRQDLLERISIWHFDIPSLAERREDIPANCQFALEHSKNHAITTFSDRAFEPDAEKMFIEFCQDDKMTWDGNFREFNAMVWRMATLAKRTITVRDVQDEIKRWKKMRKAERKTLKANSAGTAAEPSQTSPLPDASCSFEFLRELLGEEEFNKRRLDELAQIAFVVSVCAEAKNQADASRRLRINQNDSKDASPQLSKYLKKLGLDFDKVKSFAHDLTYKRAREAAGTR